MKSSSESMVWTHLIYSRRPQSAFRRHSHGSPTGLPIHSHGSRTGLALGEGPLAVICRFCWSAAAPTGRSPVGALRARCLRPLAGPRRGVLRAGWRPLAGPRWGHCGSTAYSHWQVPGWGRCGRTPCMSSVKAVGIRAWQLQHVY